MHLKAEAFEVRQCHADVIELAAGQHVFGERRAFSALFPKDLFVTLGRPRDGVMEKQAIGL